MLKKTTLAVLLVSFIGILVWGGVNRTLAKSNDGAGGNANNQNSEHVEYAEGNGVQQRGSGNQGQGNYAQNETHEEEATEGIALQADALAQGQSNGNGFQVDQTKENYAAPADGTSNSYGVSGENQATASGQGNSNGGGRGNGNGGGNGQGGGYEPLTATEIEALQLALNDEYHALAVYQSVIASFGESVPFVEIAQSEQKHIDALVNQFNKHGLPVPENPWLGQIPAFDSVQQACQTGVAAEMDNAGVYDQLFSMTDNVSLTRVFTNLRNASLNSHLPQFQACQ